AEIAAMLGMCTLGEDFAVLLDLVLRDADRLRSQMHDLGVQLARGQRDGAAAADRGAAGERADALVDTQRIAADDRNLLRRHAELAGRDLRERGLEPLPLRRHAGEDR